MKILLYRIVQWTWGLPQTLIGFVLLLIYRKCPHYSYHGSVVTEWDGFGSVSLGMYILLSGKHPQKKAVLAHEYGHTIQSLMLGPLYMLFVAFPSFAWAGLPRAQRYRRKKKVSYYTFYTESWANRLAERTIKEKTPK